MGWLGVDVGTSSTKAVVYGDDGRPVGHGRAATPWRTGPDGVDVDPQELLDSALAAVDAALDAAGVPVGGVGITSMGETGVLVDGGGAPVAPAIAWYDTRDGAETAQLARDVDAVAFTRRTGKPLTQHYALTKHRWLTAHVPTSRAAVRRFNVAEWVARGLGADEACERSLASRTGWLDVAKEAFDDELLAWSGASASLMPPLVEAGRPLGTARAHPRLAGAVVTIAGHDHQAAAVGVGVTAGDVLDSSGTAEALLRTVAAGLAPEQVEALAAEGITTDLSVRPGCWSLLGGTQGGLAMRRVLGMLGVAWADLAALDVAALAAGRDGPPAGPVPIPVGRPGGATHPAGPPGDGHRFHPAAVVRIEGIGTAAVTVADVRDGVGPGDVWRAAVETATVDAADRLAAMERIVGPHRRVVVTGGWTASAMVMDAKRRLLGRLTVADVAEAGTLGAATMAARAAGHLGPDDVLGPG